MGVQIVKAADEKGYRARSDRRLTQGIVVARDDIAGTCVIDVGVYDVNGSAVLLRDVPFSRNSIPQIRDTITLLYSNSSPHSLSVSGGQVGGGNTNQTVDSNGLSSLKADSNPKLKGDVQLVSGTGVTLSQSGQQITVNVSSGSLGPSRALSVITSSAALSADTTKIYIRILDSASSIVLTLPDPTVHVGVEIYVAAVSNPTLGHTLARNGSEKIDKTAADVTMGTGTGRVARIAVISNGTDWFSINKDIA